ncbi:MAG TPA: SPOR domain-containing protein [Gammaproteobacteria bacterium]|nr:SPOR domain-containing protein [Gammaproteobacteria bacterium]
MATDYRRRTRRKRKPSGPPAWAWAAIGLIVGLFVAFLVFLQMRPQQPAAQHRETVLEKPAEHDSRELRKPRSKPAPPPKPRFDFYNLLPEMEVIVPEQEIRGTPTHEGVKQVEKPGIYLLQAGSFRSHKQADQLRARLALLGMETRIQTVSINNKQAWHRVRVGPYDNLRELNQARSELKKNGIDAILIRLKN